MTIGQLFQDKTITAKRKVSTIGGWLTHNDLQIVELLAFAEEQKAKDKAICLEALEYSTKKVPTIADKRLLNFCNQSNKG